MIPYGRQDISEDDINEVLKVLNSDFLTQGPQVPLFEKTIADYCGSKYSVAVNSATSALHIACLALGVEKGDWIWTSPNSFVASANCGIYCDASVDFVDIDPKTYNISVKILEKKLVQAKKANKLPKVIVVVHFAGQSCDMQKIHSLSIQFGFKVIEDASHAIGGRYLDSIVGSCKYSEVTIFSFHPVKIITTAEGGVATTNSKELNEKMQILRSHGITRNQNQMTKDCEGDWYYQQIDLGFNYRMTELQAALGVSQMKRLNEFVSKRHMLKKRYDKLLKDFPVIIPFQAENVYSALHLYPIQIVLNNVQKTREQIFNELRTSGIGVNVHYIPIHMQPYYQQLGFKKGDFPNSEEYYSKVISIPLFNSMTLAQQDEVIANLKMIIK